MPTGLATQKTVQSQITTHDGKKPSHLDFKKLISDPQTVCSVGNDPTGSACK